MAKFTKKYSDNYDVEMVVSKKEAQLICALLGRLIDGTQGTDKLYDELHDLLDADAPISRDFFTNDDSLFLRKGVMRNG